MASTTPVPPLSDWQKAAHQSLRRGGDAGRWGGLRVRLWPPLQRGSWERVRGVPHRKRCIIFAAVQNVNITKPLTANSLSKVGRIWPAEVYQLKVMKPPSSTNGGFAMQDRENAFLDDP